MCGQNYSHTITTCRARASTANDITKGDLSKVMYFIVFVKNKQDFCFCQNRHQQILIPFLNKLKLSSITRLTFETTPLDPHLQN